MYSQMHMYKDIVCLSLPFFPFSNKYKTMIEGTVSPAPLRTTTPGAAEEQEGSCVMDGVEPSALTNRSVLCRRPNTILLYLHHFIVGYFCYNKKIAH